MTRPKTQYQGVRPVTDRHGKTRYRFRMTGKPSRYLPGPWGSPEFEKAYYEAMAGRIEPTAKPTAGSFDWLIEKYLKDDDFTGLKPRFKRNLTLEIERFRRDHGHRSVAGLDDEVVRVLVGKKRSTPAAANKLLKLLRRLCKFAIRKKVIRTDPTYTVKSIRYETDGYHTWTDAEIAQFEDHHGIESKPVLAMRLMLYTGAARQDAARMGWQNISGERIIYRRHKTGSEVILPIHPALAEVLAFVPADKMLFLTHTGDRPYKPETFGMWFKDQCIAAGLPHCTSHGLRKAGATRIANAGYSEFHIMAFLGHKTTDEARTYTKKANRAKLGSDAMEGLKTMSNPVTRLDKHRRKELKRKAK